MSTRLVCAFTCWKVGQVAMGYVDIIRGNKITSIVEGNEMVRYEPICDECNESKPNYGGLTIRIADDEALMWFCSDCRERRLAQ